MEIEPRRYNLDSFMHGRLFRVPEYQRAYAWEKKQRSDLFGDIRRVKERNEDHFMATFVGLARKAEKRRIIADEFAVIEIVDGQQRLTTLIILLKAIHKSLDVNDKQEKTLADELKSYSLKMTNTLCFCCKLTMIQVTSFLITFVMASSLALPRRL